MRVGKPCDLRPFICADAPDFPSAQPALRLRSSCLIVQPRRDFGSQACPFRLRAETGAHWGTLRGHRKAKPLIGKALSA